MRTIDVPPQDWRRTLDQISAVHDGWLVSLDVVGPLLGAQPQIRELPLRGITAETGPRDPVITIAAARGDGEHITHVIQAASIRRFRTAAEADNVEGMPRPS